MKTGAINWGSPVVPGGLNTGLVSWWLARPGISGNTWYDLCGKNHGTLTNGPTWASSTRIGNATSLNCDGTDDYCLTPSFGFNYGQMTVCASFNVTGTISNASRYTFFDTSDGNVAGCPSLEIFAMGSTTFQLQGIIPGVYLIGQGAINSSDGGTYNKNTWYEIAYTIDNASTTAKNYVNGLLNATSNFGAQTFASTAQQKDIGRRSSASQYWPGQLDNIRIYNRTLSPTEVWQLANDPYNLLTLNRLDRRWGYAVAASTLFRRSLSNRIGSRGAA